MGFEVELKVLWVDLKIFEVEVEEGGFVLKTVVELVLGVELVLWVDLSKFYEIMIKLIIFRWQKKKIQTLWF
mgnify:CR=1 FL=1